MQLVVLQLGRMEVGGSRDTSQAVLMGLPVAVNGGGLCGWRVCSAGNSSSASPGHNVSRLIEAPCLVNGSITHSDAIHLSGVFIHPGADCAISLMALSP